MSQQNQNENQETVFTPSDDLQVVMQSGLPVSVIVPMEEFDRMNCIILLAQELLEGKEFDMANGKKGSFSELAEERIAADRAEYEAELAAMFEDDEDASEEDAEELN